jgi:TonB family protein
MTAQAAIFGVQEQDARTALARSLLLHAALIGGLTLYAWWNNSGDPFGSPDAGGSAVGIEAVASIPLPSRGPQTPVASDTDSEVPQAQPEKPQPKPAEPELKDALNLLPPERTAKQPLTPKPRLKSFDEIAANQLTSRNPQAVSSPMFSGGAGAGNIGASGDTTLGNRFPAYAAQIKELTRLKWRVQDVDRSVTSAPPVIIRFDLQKDGRATNIRLIRRSGVPSLDLSVQNAVEDASPYPPLPPGFERDSVPVEFTFELRR